MPNLLDKNQNKTINTIQLSNALRLFSHRTRFAVVEKVSARPGNAAQSTFKLGQALGIVEGILGCLQIPVLYAVPSVWKLMMKLSANKKDSLKLAREMFPESHTWLAREKDHDRAESILLAVYGAYFLKK